MSHISNNLFKVYRLNQFMPKKLDKCVLEVKKKIKQGKIKKTYMRKGKRIKTNPYAICKSALKRKKK